jgi:toluene monooxygenase system ferredoxin subunit
MPINERLPTVCTRGGDCRGSVGTALSEQPLPGGWKRLCPVVDVPAGGMKTFHVEGVGVLVVDLGDQLVAVQSLCPHESIPLDRGVVEGPTITCLEHLWQFDVRSGAPQGAATEGLRTFALRNEDGDLFVALE